MYEQTRLILVFLLVQWNLIVPCLHLHLILLWGFLNKEMKGTGWQCVRVSAS